MRYFEVHYLFRHGINGHWEQRTYVAVFDDIDPETTDGDLKAMAERELNNKFETSQDFPLYGKFWEITDVVEINY